MQYQHWSVCIFYHQCKISQYNYSVLAFLISPELVAGSFERNSLQAIDLAQHRDNLSTGFFEFKPKKNLLIAS